MFVDNIDFIFIGKYADFTLTKKYLEINGQFKALHFIDENLQQLSQEDNILLKSLDEINNGNYFDSNTLVISSSLLSSKDTIFNALEKGSNLLLLDYKDISIDDCTKLEEYSKKCIISFHVPIFAHSKSILLKKMMGMYTRNKHITMSIHDIENPTFESELFLLALNLINKENIDKIEIQKLDNGIGIVTNEHNITFCHINNKKHSFIHTKTNDKAWRFEWKIFGSLNIYHTNSVKEHYSHSQENTTENICKNMCLNCVGSTQILYTTVEELLIYCKIKEAFYNMHENTSISISL